MESDILLEGTDDQRSRRALRGRGAVMGLGGGCRSPGEELGLTGDGDLRLRKLVLWASIGSSASGCLAGGEILNSAYQFGTSTYGMSKVRQNASSSSGTLSSAERPWWEADKPKGNFHR